jgi:hypothetical protein
MQQRRASITTEYTQHLMPHPDIFPVLRRRTIAKIEELPIGAD